MRTVVRAARKTADRKLIVRMARQCFAPSDCFLLKHIRGESCFLLFVGNELIGSTVLHEEGYWHSKKGRYIKDKKYLYIICTVLLPRFQGLGLGQFLKSWQIAYAISKKFRVIRTTTRTSNFRMLALNEKLGFKKVGLIKGFYHDPNEDGVIMELPI